jgi:hypothetical protein
MLPPDPVVVPVEPLLPPVVVEVLELPPADVPVWSCVGAWSSCDEPQAANAMIKDRPTLRMGALLSKLELLQIARLRASEL